LQFQQEDQEFKASREGRKERRKEGRTRMQIAYLKLRK
jgi:hypothetical protein